MMIPSQTLILQTHMGLMLSTWTVPDQFSRATHMLTVQSVCQIRAFMSNRKIKGKSPSSINCNELLLAAQFKIASGQIPGRPLGIKWCGLVATEPGNTFFLDKAPCQSCETLTLWWGCFCRLRPVQGFFSVAVLCTILLFSTFWVEFCCLNRVGKLPCS